MPSKDRGFTKIGGETTTGAPRTLLVNDDGSLPISATIAAGDLEVGAVELKNAATDDRALIAAPGATPTFAVATLPSVANAADPSLTEAKMAYRSTDLAGYSRSILKAETTKVIGVVNPKQYSGVPSSFAILTADGTVFTLAAGEVGFIQNLDDAALAVKLGASASTTSMSYLLAACSAAAAGDGGAIRITDWVGVVSVAAMTGTASYLAWKQT